MPQGGYKEERHNFKSFLCQISIKILIINQKLNKIKVFKLAGTDFQELLQPAKRL
jgi:hypothetical protein